jgi:hypothetical protein
MKSVLRGLTVAALVLVAGMSTSNGQVVDTTIHDRLLKQAKKFEGKLCEVGDLSSPSSLTGRVVVQEYERTDVPGTKLVSTMCRIYVFNDDGTVTQTVDIGAFELLK